MKKVLNTIKEINANPYHTANTVNYEGHPAWKTPTIQAFEQLLMTGSTGNTFYVKQKDNIVQLINTINKALKEEDTNLVAGIIVKARQEGFMRTAPIIALALLRKTNPIFFKSIFNHVILTGNDLIDFIEINKSLGYGFGNTAKECMINWIKKNTNPFYAIKYRKQIADAIRLSRPKVDGTEMEYLLKYIMKKYKKIDDNTINKALEQYPQLYHFEEAKKAIMDDDYDKAVKHMREGRLEPSTLIGLKNINNLKFWEEAMKQMGTMMLLKYLNKLLREGVFEKEENIQYLKERMTAENLSKARILPFRLVIAYMNINKALPNAMEVMEVLANATDSYIKKYDFKEWMGSWAICPDVSGSMTWSHSSPRPCEIAGMFASVLYKGIKDSILLPWDEKIRTEYIKPKSSSTIDIAERIANASGWGTYMEVPLEYLINNNIKKDYVLFITDSEEWGKGWLKYWINYKKQINPKAKAIIIRVDSYTSKPYDPASAEKYDIYDVYGWSDNVFKWIELKILKN